MKRFTLLVSILSAVLLNSVTSNATQNPQIRACNSSGGQFMVANSEFDQWGLCKFDLSLVGAIDILNRDAQIEVPLSLFNYKRGVQACSSDDLTTLKTLEGQSLEVCQYSDGSIIDLETLTSGKDNERNKALNTALGL